MRARLHATGKDHRSAHPGSNATLQRFFQLVVGQTDDRQIGWVGQILQTRITRVAVDPVITRIDVMDFTVKSTGFRRQHHGMPGRSDLGRRPDQRNTARITQRVDGREGEAVRHENRMSDRQQRQGADGWGTTRFSLNKRAFILSVTQACPICKRVLTILAKSGVRHSANSAPKCDTVPYTQTTQTQGNRPSASWHEGCQRIKLG